MSTWDRAPTDASSAGEGEGRQPAWPGRESKPTREVGAASGLGPSTRRGHGAQGSERGAH